MGYRKNRGAKQAVEYLGKELNFGKYTYIVEADIKGFFDNVNHQWLKRMLEEKVRDKRIITLIEKWLKAGIIFTFRWEKSRKGKDIITHKTSKKGFKRTIQKFKEWIRKNRHCRLMKMFKELNTKLRGYYNYYGTIGNSKKITQVYRIVIGTLYKWLNRRSQRKSFIWGAFGKVIKRYKLLKPYIASRYQQTTIKISC
ncbi:group II intron maturase [Natranaerovirga pectinivora]|uniref:Group II intron maturase n=3 Tax=Natranaerovirga pectinivora TaxID=682400 RepID=A0A4R3MND7_9FIRM|nr:group II intron maturase [Natranaerovirga pectinivora]